MTGKTTGVCEAEWEDYKKCMMVLYTIKLTHLVIGKRETNGSIVNTEFPRRSAKRKLGNTKYFTRQQKEWIKSFILTKQHHRW
jgi:hypothetical protein